MAPRAVAVARRRVQVRAPTLAPPPTSPARWEKEHEEGHAMLWGEAARGDTPRNPRRGLEDGERFQDQD